jgi:hypothetical protein
MKTIHLEKIYTMVILVIFGGIVLHAPLSVGFGVLFPHFDVVIKSWKEILMLLITPLAAVIITRHHLWAELARDWVVRLLAAYAALHILIASILPQRLVATAAGFAIDLRYILFFGLVYILIRAAPQYRPVMIKIGVIGAVIVVGFATVQLFLPPDILSHIGYSQSTIAPYLTVDKNPDYIRVNSTLRGPNPLGAYAGMVLAFIAAALVKGILTLRRRRIAVGVTGLVLCSAIALWVSYSRSALIAALIMLGVVFGVTVARRVSRRVWITSAVILIALLGGIVTLKGGTFISNVLLHENPQGGSSVSSNDGHVSSLRDGVVRLAHQPLGAGVGSTGSASLRGQAPTIVEDQYLFVAHETGWLGLALFAALSGLLIVRLWRRRSDWLSLGAFASGIGLTFIGILLPVWADDTVSIIWWGLAALALGGARRDR